MGNLNNKIVRQEATINKKIDKNMLKEKQGTRQIIKVLLLGTGDSGKSTIFKQTKRYSGKDVTVQERRKFIKPVLGNIINEIRKLIEAVRVLHLEFEEEKSIKEIESVTASDLQKNGLTEDLKSHIVSLWEQECFQLAWKSRARFQVFECLEYFLQAEVLSRISKEGRKYMPTFNDMLNCRFKTVGIIKEVLKINTGLFEFVDVGGQRSERRKWLGVFNNCTSVLFVSSLSEFDENLFEDRRVPRLDESLRVWSDIVNREDFKNVAFLLFLNKWDLFQKKLKQTTFKSIEPGSERNLGFDGVEPGTLEEDSSDQKEAIGYCAEFLESQFVQRVDLTGREGGITTHYSVATDTKNFQIVFSGCVQQIFKDALTVSGF